MWSDPDVIDLAKKFVVATDEVWRLQRGTDPESRYFQKMADQGHYRGKDGTRQGIYVMAPGGKLLSSVNSLKVEKVLKTMKQGLQAWKGLSAKDKTLSDPDLVKPSHRWENSLPKRGLILTVFSRELPKSFNEKAKRGPGNRDHAWFTAAEARGFVGEDPRVGSVHTASDLLVRRIARFHLVDNIVGQGLPFAAQELIDCKIETVVTARKGDIVSIRMNGQTRAVAKGPWLMAGSEFEPKKEYPRGIETSLHGFATLDFVSGEVTRFRLLAVGKSWGMTPYNSQRTDGLKKTPIGFLLRLAGNELGRTVAPAFISENYGPWVEKKKAAK